MAITGALLTHVAASNHNLGASPHPPIDIANIVTTTVQAATLGMVAATAAVHVVKTASIGVRAMLERKKKLHICMIYGVPTNDDIPAIWMALANTKTRQKGHSHLVAYVMSGMLDFVYNILLYQRLYQPET